MRGSLSSGNFAAEERFCGSWLVRTSVRSSLPSGRVSLFGCQIVSNHDPLFASKSDPFEELGSAFPDRALEGSTTGGARAPPRFDRHRSVPAEPSWRVDCLEVGEIEFTDRLQRLGGGAFMQAGRQCFQPGGIPECHAKGRLQRFVPWQAQVRRLGRRLSLADSGAALKCDCPAGPDRQPSRSGSLQFQNASLRVPRTHQLRGRCGAAREMRAGPSEPAIRSWLQTAASCWRQERWW